MPRERYGILITAWTYDNEAVPSNKSGLLLSRRVRQAADREACNELEKLWEAFNKSADETAQKFSDNLKLTPAGHSCDNVDNGHFNSNKILTIDMMTDDIHDTDNRHDNFDKTLKTDMIGLTIY